MMKKADYSRIASYYDKGRTLSEQNIDLWLEIIARLSGGTRGSRVLDLGCGTGRFAIPMAVKLGYRVTGADSSEEMLDKAREKDGSGLVMWDQQDAQDLSYPEKSFDIVFMSHVLHHCASPASVISECWRVLAPGGVLLNRHSVIEEINEDPESTFFPEALAVNETRISSLEEILGLFIETGFVDIASEKILQHSSKDGYELYERMSNKNVSTLSMIPREAFERGLKRLHGYVQEHPDDPWLQYDTMRMTAGFKTK
jgi:ubiquinone/menaquinone biosynthesis C-methylase UbiE